jgi:UDP-N-acetylmuramoylalanine--D-glutamate ligase
MKWSPHVAVVGMIGADHLEWHGGTREAYVDAKRNLVRFQKPTDFAILNRDDATSSSFAKDTSAKSVAFGNNDPDFHLSISGAHNQLNAKAAFKAAEIFGVTREQAQAAIADFKGLPHRLQLVHVSANGVRYINDSIATIPEAAIAALESFPVKRVIQIVGGYDAHVPLDALANALSTRAKAVLCIGATGPAIASLMNGLSAPAQLCGILETAMTAARRLAVRDDIVLLSTGCKSYDQFTNFESRGEEFTRLARQH